MLKKILSVALALVMVIGTLSISAFAIASGSEVGLVLVADKTESQIVPGETVTVSIFFDLADWDQLMSDTKVALLFDDTVYTPDLDSRTFEGDWAGYAKDATTAKLNAAYGTAVMGASTMSAAEQATYNSAVMLTAGADAGLGATNKAGYSVTYDPNTGYSVCECTIQFEVTGDAAAVAAGNKNITICDTLNTNQFVKKTDGSTTPKNPTTPLDVSRGNILANMPAGPAVTYEKTQLKLAVNNHELDTTAQYPVQMRVTSKITDADFDTYFSNTTTHGTDPAPSTDAIIGVGLVAFDGDEASFDEATAASVVNGGTAAGYKAAETDYISKASDDADAYFGAILRGQRDAFENSPITFLGYVRYLDDAGAEQVIFYEATVTKTITTAMIDTYCANN